MKILTANDQYAVRRAGGLQYYISRLCRKRWGFAPQVECDSASAPVYAYVHRGNWVGDCGTCRGIVVVEPGIPYFCPDCGNAAHNGNGRPVIFPHMRADIEQALLMRPDPRTRWWLPGETVSDLLEQNRKHGIAGVGGSIPPLGISGKEK